MRRAFVLALSCLTASVLAGGLLLAVLEFPASALIALSVLSAAVVMTLMTPARGPSFARWAVGAAILGAAGVAGLVAFLGPVVLGGIVAIGLCWLALALADRSARQLPESTPTRPDTAYARDEAARHDAFDEDVLQPIVAGWSDEELCRAWQRSFHRLHDDDEYCSVAEVAQLRRLYLDELRARYPAGVDSWLTSGARAAGSPARYLHRSS